MASALLQWRWGRDEQARHSGDDRKHGVPVPADRDLRSVWRGRPDGGSACGRTPGYVRASLHPGL